MEPSQNPKRQTIIHDISLEPRRQGDSSETSLEIFTRTKSSFYLQNKAQSASGHAYQ